MERPGCWSGLWRTQSWHRSAGIVLALLAATMTAACGLPDDAAPQPLAHGVYVWQRAWNGALEESIRSAVPLVSQYRVLAAEVDRRGRFHRIAVDHTLLRQTARPIVPVFRVDGYAPDLESRAVEVLVSTVASDWTQAGTQVTAVEIDFDCATNRIAEYARFLETLRTALPASIRLGITALPDWMNSPDLPRLLNAADDVVLQVHSVDDPATGLFNEDRAIGWINRFARLGSRPFAIALPAYGSRVGWGLDGRVVAVESEALASLRGARSVELRVAPEVLQRVVQRLERTRPPQLHTIMWFRLPTGRDRRAWSFETWAAVVRGSVLAATTSVRLSKPDAAGSREVIVVNSGTTDAELPATIEIAGDCGLADAINGYQLVRNGDALRFERDVALFPLRAGHHTVVGWLRCTEPEVRVHASS